MVQIKYTSLVLFPQLLCAKMCPKSSISNIHIIDLIFFKSFDFWYIFLFFLEHIKNRLKNIRF